MKNKTLEFRAELLRKIISYCAKSECSVKNQCLHYLAFDNDKDTLEAYFINPRKVQGNAQCIKFLSNKVQRVGCGFRKALAQIPKGKITIRHKYNSLIKNHIRLKICTTPFFLSVKHSPQE